MLSPYQILGVSSEASDEEIKQAYRKLAIQWHPDRNPGNPEAEAKFKEVQSAYEKIKDVESRAGYQSEQLGHQFKFDESIFSDVFNFPNLDVMVNISLSFLEPRQTNSKEVVYFRNIVCQICGGSGIKQLASYPCQVCRGIGRTFNTLGFLKIGQKCQTCRGQGRQILENCQTCNGNGSISEKNQTTITIPAGILDGQALCLTGLGHQSSNAAGNLIVVVKTEVDPRWERRNSDVISHIKISYPELILGTQLPIETVWGTETLTIHPGTSLDDPIILIRKGFPQLNRLLNETSIERGDHYCILTLKIPTQISDEHRNLLEKLSKI